MPCCAVLETVASYTIMAGDVPTRTQCQPDAGVSTSISGDEADRLRTYWDQLSEGAALPRLMRRDCLWRRHGQLGNRRVPLTFEAGSFPARDVPERSSPSTRTSKRRFNRSGFVMA